MEDNFDESIDKLIKLGIIEEIFVNGKSVGYCLADDEQAKVNAYKEANRLN